MSTFVDITGRPFPPKELADSERPHLLFTPAIDLAFWVKSTFIGEGPLYNPDHDHLLDADIGFLWTSVENSRHGRIVVGTCEIPNAHGGKWTKAREAHQLEQWFGIIPDFLITLDAVYADELDDASFCAFVEHELYHAGQKTDRYGVPRFDRKTGVPSYCLVGHDVEEHIGVVRRYGSGAAAAGVLELVEASQQEPEIAEAKIRAACGNCLR